MHVRCVRATASPLFLLHVLRDLTSGVLSLCGTFVARCDVLLACIIKWLCSIGLVAVSAYICYRVLRSCEELSNDWSAETDLRYSHPSLVQNYYGEAFDNSRSVGEAPTMGEEQLETREAEVPDGDTPRPGDVLRESSGGSGRFFSLWRCGLPEGYECETIEGVPFVRDVNKGTRQDIFKLD